jgi:chorismate mutase
MLDSFTLGFMAKNYGKALRDAEVELEGINGELRKLEQRRAQLQSTIAGLKSLTGQPVTSDESLTEIIRTVLKGNRSGYLSVNQVAANARVLGSKVPVWKVGSVGTILNRLVRNGEAEQGLTDTGYVGYKWQYRLSDLK